MTGIRYKYRVNLPLCLSRIHILPDLIAPVFTRCLVMLSIRLYPILIYDLKTGIFQSLPYIHSLPAVDIPGAGASLDRPKRACSVKCDRRILRKRQYLILIFQQHHSVCCRPPCQRAVLHLIFLFLQTGCSRKCIVSGSFQIHLLCSHQFCAPSCKIKPQIIIE